MARTIGPRKPPEGSTTWRLTGEFLGDGISPSTLFMHLTTSPNEQDLTQRHYFSGA